jgi:hypothetical protein
MDLEDQMELRNKAFALADMELDRANKIHPMFSDPRVGESVIREELEEAEEALGIVMRYRDAMWERIRHNKEMDISELERMGNAALELTCEVIQITAMIRKFIISMEGWKDEQSSFNRPANS